MANGRVSPVIFLSIWMKNRVDSDKPASLDWLQSLKQFFNNVSKTEPSELDWLQVYDNDTLLKNCFKDWSQSTASSTLQIQMWV